MSDIESGCHGFLKADALILHELDHTVHIFLVPLDFQLLSDIRFAVKS
jgi:hypothetical protein